MKFHKRNSLRKVVTASLVLALLACSSIGVNASNGGSGTISGESTVYAPVFNVLVPTSIPIYLDPMGYEVPTSSGVGNGSGTDVESQIAAGGDGKSDGFAFLNLSSVPVKLSVETTITPVQDVYIMDRTEIIDDPSNTDKEIALEIAPAQTATVDDSGANLSITAFHAANVIKPNINSPGKNSIMNFILYKRSAPGTQAANSEGVAAFTFQGRLNPIASWGAGDIKVDIKYTFTGLSEGMYTTAASNFVANGLNLASANTSLAPFTSSVSPSITLGTLNYVGTFPTVGTVNLGSGNKAGTTISSVSLTKDNITQYVLILGVDYTYSVVNRTLTIPEGRFSWMTDDIYQLEVLFANGKKCVTDFNLDLVP